MVWIGGAYVPRNGVPGPDLPWWGWILMVIGCVTVVLGLLWLLASCGVLPVTEPAPKPSSSTSAPASPTPSR